MKNIRRLIVFIFILTLALFCVITGGNYMRRDTEGPVISFDKEVITASIEDSDMDLIKGVTAQDKIDGDVSDSLIIESVQRIEGNECETVYAAFDHSNNVSKASRTVEYEDYRPIHFQITAPMRFANGSKGDILKNVSANDCIDGDITNRIKLVSKEDDSEYSGEGIYDYEFQVTNSIGDTAVLPVSVEFYTDTYEERLFRPNIRLTDYVVYIKKGEKLDAKKYLDSISIGNELYIFDENVKDQPMITEDGREITGTMSRNQVRVQSGVNNDREGTYTVNYSYTTEDKHIGTSQLIVVVE